MQEGNHCEEHEGREFEPYVPAERAVPEFTLRSVILGCVLGIVFGAANAYLGLKVGMTVSASIPVAVISMAILRGVFRRGTVLENNMVQTIGSAGESLAAGVIFTVPAIILLNVDVGLLKIMVLGLLGGWLGVLFMIPLRRYLIVSQHKKLPYPEGTACAEVLVAGDTGGVKAKKVFSGVGWGAVYTFLMDPHGLGLWKESPSWRLPIPRGAQVGVETLPSLLGVGFIIGPKISAYMLSGGILGWLVFIPLFYALGATLSEPIYPASVPISQMDPSDIWSNYIRYIGAGAVAVGGIMSLIKAIPTVVESVKLGLGKAYKAGAAAGARRTDRDLSLKFVAICAIAMGIAIWLLPQVDVGIVGGFMTVLFCFLFVTVSSRIVGIVGSSSNPASGMTIATLLGTSLIFVLFGIGGTAGMVAALSVGAVVCIAICIAGDTSQDLKTGFLVGATPNLQQIGELLGVLTSALFVGWTLFILHDGYGIGSAALPAPQATLMKMVVQGVFQGQMPWGLVMIGAFAALIVELLGISALPFAVGLYLPLNLTTPIMIGALVKSALEKTKDAEQLKVRRESGVLFSSGLIAGGALVGIILAVLACSGAEMGFGGGEWMGFLNNPISLALFLGLGFVLYRSARSR
ncbi:MAG: oligopeptide transporter, OPT family [Candidatus Coatesbacteria bacterium]|nr:oligopeptide transporter, OPT family [Candidatus Coatesbacteria bacterium]